MSCIARMSKLVQVKLTLTPGDVARIDYLVEEGKFASRADFGHKAVFLLLSSIDGTLNDVKTGHAKTEKQTS